jgi:tetratricopeptide (TPR) repeat protein
MATDPTPTADSKSAVWRVLRLFDPADDACLNRLLLGLVVVAMLGACTVFGLAAAVMRNERAQYAMLFGLVESEDYNLALRLADYLVKQHPTSNWDYYRQKAVALRRMGRIDESLAVYDDAIAAFPNDWWPRSHRCFYTVLLTGDAETALPYCDQALELNPDEPAVAYDRRAIARAVAGDLEGAKADLEKALELFDPMDEYAADRLQTRERWLKMLEQGINPMTEEELAKERARY